MTTEHGPSTIMPRSAPATKGTRKPRLSDVAPGVTAQDLAVLEAEASVIAGDPRQSLLNIERDLNLTFAEREREIRGLIVALVAGEHVLLLGPAGTGKSALAQTMCSAIVGGNYFEWLLTRFSTPEELFGPVSLDGLKQDRFRRVTAGKLPEATVGFLDEIFKANSAILNALLTILNERRFDNDGARHDVPLETVVGASNELPEGPELAALFDRFLLRYWVGYTRSQDSFDRLINGDEPRIASQISLTEIAAIQAEAAAVTIPAATIEELFKLRAELQGAGVVVSDRRWRKAAKILRATAWLEGATEVTTDVFPMLTHVLWDLPDQQTAIVQKVARYVSVELAEAHEAFDAISQLLGELPGADTPEFANRVSGCVKEVKRAIEKVEALAKQSRGGVRPKVEKVHSDLKDVYNKLRKQAQTALGL